MLEPDRQTHVQVAMLADASPEAGLGHLGRSSAVAIALRARGVTVDCLGYGAPGPVELDGVRWRPAEDLSDMPQVDAYLLDSYHVEPADFASLGPFMAMHDHGGGPSGAALVLSVASDAPRPGWLVGPRYACLRPAFWGLPTAAPRLEVRRVLVATGAADTGAHAADLAGAARSALPDAEVDLLIGPYSKAASPPGVNLLRAPHGMFGPLSAADLVVTAAGQTMLEASAVGVPCVAVVLAENQRAQARRLAACGAVEAIGAADTEDVARAARELASSQSRRAQMAQRGQEAVDGFGALRAAFHLAELARERR